MSQKLSVNIFELIEDASQFNEDFIKNYNEEVIKDIFSRLVFTIMKTHINFLMIYHFYQK